MSHRGSTAMQQAQHVAPQASRGAIVAYYRVSTQKQGKSGLGLEAQRIEACGCPRSRLGGHLKTGHAWTSENRPYDALETGVV